MTAPSVPGLLRVGGVVILSGPALKPALDAVLIAANRRRDGGLSTSQHHRDLAAALSAAMSAAVRDEPPVPPSLVCSMTIDDAAIELGLSPRHVRRLAPDLGRKTGPHWRLNKELVGKYREARRDDGQPGPSGSLEDGRGNVG
ncbi:MAG: hypothetical protein QOC62_4626 [Mycobacterium sp.]|jgi:hypothetical protein|nr:hypothetical protein [Mycobacterium sp.]